MGVKCSCLEELVDIVLFSELEEAKRLLDDKPELMLSRITGCDHPHSLVSDLAMQCRSGNEMRIKEFMDYMILKAFSLTNSGEEYVEMLRDIFESNNPNGRPPIFYAFRNSGLFIHLIEKCCSTGKKYLDDLQKIDKNGASLAYDMIFTNFNPESFEYLVENASNGTDVICHAKTNIFHIVQKYEKSFRSTGLLTSILPFAGYLESVRGKSFLLRQEQKLLEKTRGHFPDDSLVNLVLGVLGQNTELIRYRESSRECAAI